MSWTTIIRELKASFAFVERNFNLVRRYIEWEGVFLAYDVVNALTIGLIAVAQRDQRLVLFLVIGSLMWGFLSVIFNDVSNSISWERWEGTIEYTLMAPIHRLTHLGGTCMFAVVYGMVRTVLILVALSVFFDLDLANANFVSAAAVLLVSGISFMGLGILAGILPLISPEKGAQATHIFQAGILLVSGVYYDVSVLPAWLQPASVISPATYTLRAVRAALLDGASLRQVSGDLLILFLSSLVLLPVGLWAFGRAELWAKKTGKLKRNG